jgi:hypothetical protein
MKLEFCDTAFELILTEQPDREMIAMITERFDQINMPFTNPKNPSGEKLVGKAARKLWNNYVSQLDEPVIYQSKNKGEPSRMYAKRTSCQGLPSAFRNSMYQHVATDTDAVCCHPTIALYVAKHFGIMCDEFQRLVDHREDVMNTFIDKLGWSRKQAKQLYNATLYGQHIPIEVHENEECYSMIESFKQDCDRLAEQIKLRFPALMKEAEKKDKFKPSYSAMSSYLNNLENQIVLKAMEFFAQRGIKVFVYCFDGFLHSLVSEDKKESLYRELNAYIFETTGIALKFIDKKMDKFIPFSNILELHELAPEVPEVQVEKQQKDILDFDVEPLMEFNFQLIESYCIDYKDELEDLSTRDDFLKPIYRLCDYFFSTITDENYLIVRHNYKIVNGKKMKKIHYAVKYNNFLSTFATDQNTKTLRKCGLLYKPCFSLTNDYFLGYEQKKKYPRLNFYPSLDEQPFYNVFKGFEIQPSEEKVDEKDIKPFLDHIKFIWCKGNEVYYKHVLGLFAQAVQQPWNRWNVALVLKSKEGAGKGAIIDRHIAQIIGEFNAITGKQGHFRPVKNQNDIFGQFTTILEGCCMLFFDEMVWGGDKKNAGILKALITQPTVKVEHKHVGLVYSQSYINILMATNEEWSVPAGDEARRYFVLELDNTYAGIPTPESKKYFDAILGLSTQKVADFLYQYDLSGFDSRSIPITEALNDEKKMSMDSSTSWLYQELGYETQWEEYSNGFDKTFLYERYVNWCRSSHQYRISADSTFWKNVKMMIIREYKPRVDGVQKRYVQFYPLKDAREIWMKTIKIHDESWDIPIEEEKK